MLVSQGYILVTPSTSRARLNKSKPLRGNLEQQSCSAK